MYWHPIVDAAPLIAAQLVFAYAFDMLLVWTRRDRYVLGFGPFPVVFSTNLFLRFHDDWFYLQFAMIALGFLAKELIRWRRDGRSVHVFNPSSFPLAVFSAGLLLTGTTYLTWGEAIATQLFLPPHIYLYIFCISLPGELLFGVVTMTGPAVVTTYLISMLWLKVTGTYLFVDSNVPIGVFLGMHLLFTDPSTSPRSDLGRALFGIVYGAAVVVLFIILGWCGAPRFYDKLLQVPLMNLGVRWFDRVADFLALRLRRPQWIAATVRPLRRNAAYVALWVIVFSAIAAANGVGDYHPGHTVLFWVRACDQGKRDGCRNLADIEGRFCAEGSAWACNELGLLATTGRASTDDAGRLFARACSMGSAAACTNGRSFQDSHTAAGHDDPTPADYLRLLGGNKAPVAGRSAIDVLHRACDAGWMPACGDLGLMYYLGRTVAVNKPVAAHLMETACDGGHAASCSNLAVLFRDGDGVPPNRARAVQLLRRACELGMRDACRWLSENASTN